MQMEMFQESDVKEVWSQSMKVAAFFYCCPRHGVVLVPQSRVSVADMSLYDGFINGEGDIKSIEEVINDQIDSLFDGEEQMSYTERVDLVFETRDERIPAPAVPEIDSPAPVINRYAFIEAVA